MATRFYVVLQKSNILFIVLSLFLICAQLVSAATKGGVEISPAYVDVDLPTKSASVAFPLTYANRSQASITLELFPLDFRQSNPNGGIGFLGESAGEYSYSLSSYLSFETNRVDLEPGETKTVIITARNRQDLTPGGHYAAVIARQVQNDSSETTIAPAVSTLIYLRKVGGEIYNLSLDSLSWPRTISFSYPSTITALFQNEGNIHLVPTGRMEVTDLFGRMLYTGNLNEGFVRVLPESRRYIPIYLKRQAIPLPLSVNTMRFTGTDSLRKVTFQQTEVFITIHPVFGAILLLTVIGVVAWWRKRKSRVKVIVKPVEAKSLPIAVKKKARRKRKKKE